MDMKTTRARIVKGGKKFLTDASLHLVHHIAAQSAGTQEVLTGRRAAVRQELTERALLGLRSVAASEQEGGEPVNTAIAHTITNLLHLCDATGNDFYHLLSTAEMHYTAEISGEL